MKKEWYRVVSALLVVTLIVTIVAACGKSTKEPADSLVASETYVPATVKELEDDALKSLVEDAIDGDWDGDFAALTAEQRDAVQQKLAEKGYQANVSDKGVTYYEYTPTADKSEIADAASKALDGEKWDGKYESLDDEQKVAVRDELRRRGYDVELGDTGFEFLNEADRKQETTKYSYDRLPTQEQIIGAVADVIGSSAARKWDGNMLSLTAQQRKDVLKKLNDYGFDLAINDAGEFYIVHNPTNKVTYDTAYTPMTKGGTTMASTTVAATEPAEPMENVTGTTAAEKILAPTIDTRLALSTFGGTAGDSFRHVAAAKDGGYIATAQFLSTDGDFAGTDSSWKRMKSALVRYDKNGAFLWKTTIGGSGLNAEIGVYLEQSAELTDGSIVTVGYTGARSLGVSKDDPQDALMICYDENGSRKWIKRVAGTQEEMFASVCATPDGGFLVGGRTRSADGDFDGMLQGSIKAILIKYTADGTREWIRSFNSGGLAATFNAIAVTDTGYIYAACYSPVSFTSHVQLDMLTYAGYGGADSIIFKFDPNGELLTHRTIAGSGNDQVTCLSLANGGVIVGGVFNKNVREDSVFAGKHNYGGNDAFLVRLDASLNVEWVKTFGGAETDAVTGVAQIKGGYVAVGWSKSTDNAFTFLGSGDTDAFILTVSENGSDVTKTPLSGTKRDQALGVVNQGGKQFAVVGSTLSSTNHFAGLTPASTGQSVAFFGLYRVK